MAVSLAQDLLKSPPDLTLPSNVCTEATGAKGMNWMFWVNFREIFLDSFWMGSGIILGTSSGTILETVLKTISGTFLRRFQGQFQGQFWDIFRDSYRKFLGQRHLWLIFNIYFFYFLGKKKRILAASHFLTHQAYLFSFVTALNFDNLPPCYIVQNYELNIFGTFSGQHLNSFRDNFVGNFRDNFRTVLYELFRGQFFGPFWGQYQGQY